MPPRRPPVSLCPSLVCLLAFPSSSIATLVLQLFIAYSNDLFELPFVQTYHKAGSHDM